MSIEELKKDADELSKLLAEATRIRVKNALTVAKAEVDKEIVNLEMKARQAAERKAAADGGPSKRYLSELNEYAWDQSDKFVKIFITLDGVQNLDESNVTVSFTENSMNLHVNDLNGKDYGMTINNFVDAIDVDKSYRKLKTGLIAVYMKKKSEGKHWDHLTRVALRIKKNQEDDTKASMDSSEDALINIMKKMYNSGDSQTKQMIAKAWTESQEKVRSGRDTVEM